MSVQNRYASKDNDEKISTGSGILNFPDSQQQQQQQQEWQKQRNDPWWRMIWKLCFHRYQANPEWQHRAYLTYCLVSCMTILMVAYAIADNTNIFVYNLSLSFLHHNGGLALPMQAKEFPYKMFSSIFIHFDFWHLLTNMLLLLWLGAYLERKYHWYRWASILLMGAVGSTITYLSVYVWRTWDAANEFPQGITQDKYQQYAAHVVFVGFSGVVYTGVGMYIMETFVNWESIEQKWFKVLMTCVLCVEPILQASFRKELYDGVAVSAHIGGLFVGLGPAILYIPNDHSYVIDFLLTKVSIVTYIIIFGTLPVFVLASVYG